MTDIFINQPNINLRKNINYIIQDNYINNYLYQYVKINKYVNYNKIIKEVFQSFLNIVEIKYNNYNTKLTIIIDKIKLINYHFNNKTNNLLFEILHNNSYIQKYYNYLLNDFLVNENLNDKFNILFDKNVKDLSYGKIENKHITNYILYILDNLKKNINDNNPNILKLTKLINVLHDHKLTCITKILFNMLHVYGREIILKMNMIDILKLNDYSILKYDITAKSKILFTIFKDFIVINYSDYKLTNDFNIYDDEIQENIIRFWKYNNDDNFSITLLYRNIKQELQNYLIKKINYDIKFYIENIFKNYNDNDKYYTLIFFTKFIENTNLFETIYNIKYKQYLLENDIDFEFEKVKLSKLYKYYGNNDYKYEYVNKLERILIDININKDIHEEYKNQLLLKNDGINKCKNYINPNIITINTYSSNIWNLENDLMINVNSGILKEYVGYYDKIYNTKFDNRKLSWYGNYGNIKFMLDDKIEINCSLVIFQILEFINDKVINYSNIKDNIKIFDNYLKTILDSLVINKILLFLPNNYYRFNNIDNMEKKYYLSEKLILKDNIKKEEKISNEYIVKTNIVYCLKREKSLLKHVLFDKVKNNIKKYYDLNTEVFEKTIKKLDNDYLVIKGNLIEYLL